MSASEVIVASNAADAEAAATIKNDHAELVGRVAALTDAMLSAAERGADVETARVAVVKFLTGELLPYATAKIERLYPAAARTDQARLLVESMIGTHRVITRLVEPIRRESSPVRAAAAAHALRVLVEVQLADENDRVLPIVAADPGVSVAEISRGIREILHVSAAGNEHGPACGCGEGDADIPVLDVREIPHAIRHATVFGAFDAVPVGGSLELIAHHDPIPLLHQLHHRTSGRLAVSYIERGPEVWQLLLTKH